MKKKILIVEDNNAAREMLTEQFEEEYDVVTAANGVEAIAVAKRERPDVILMDIFLPEMDGWEATRRLREDESFANTPIVALTAHVSQEHEKKCLEAGCNLYLSKPIHPDLLKRRIRELLGEK